MLVFFNEIGGLLRFVLKVNDFEDSLMLLYYLLVFYLFLWFNNLIRNSYFYLRIICLIFYFMDYCLK